MASNTTKDHDFIREWAEKRGAKPAEVASTETENQIGILRLEFPGAPNANDDALKEIEWDDFFEKFDQSGLEFLYQEETADGEQSNFNKLIYPDPESDDGKKLLAKVARKRSSAKKSGTKTTATKKTAGKKTSAKVAAKKTPAKKTPAKKTTAKKTTTKAPATKKTAGKKIVLKASAKKSAAKKTAAKKAVAKKVAAKKVVPKKVAAKKTAAKKVATKKKTR